MYNEEKVIRLCKKRNRKAQYLFYKEHFPYLFSICLRYAREREEAMELCNLSFARIMLNLNKYDPKHQLKTWMRTVTVNCIIDEFRKRSVYKQYVTAQEEMNTAPSGEDLLHFGGNLVEVVQKCLDSVNPTTRSVFNLYAIDGYKHREIAEMLGISEGTSAWHYSEARKVLKGYLKQEQEIWSGNGRA